MPILHTRESRDAPCLLRIPAVQSPAADWSSAS